MADEIADFGTPDEITTSCTIEGCHARVLGAERCFEHGGEPTLELRTDMWGNATYRFGPQEGET